VPLPRGGTVRTTAQGGVGKMVLLAEMVLRLSRRGGRAVYVRWDERFYRVADGDREQREMGIDQVSTLVLGRMSGSTADRERTVLDGLAVAERLRDEGSGRDVLLLVDAPPTGELPLDQVRSRIGVRDRGSITLLVFELLLPNTGYAAAPLTGSGWDAQLVFDRALAKRTIYPALDVLQCASALLSDGRVSAEHARIAARVRDLLRDDPESRRAEQLRQFQSQPFFGAEPWTARPGNIVSLTDALAGYQAILDGAADELSDRDLLFAGALRKT
jgi:F-type H+/Na+-transporting ATPase subunit beta